MYTCFVFWWRSSWEFVMDVHSPDDRLSDLAPNHLHNHGGANSPGYQTLWNPGDKQDTVKIYPRRWYILGLFSLLGLTQSAIWNTWGPISDSAILVFGWNDAQIAMFANIGNILFCVTVFLSSWVMDVLGKHTCMLLLAIVLTTACIQWYMSETFLCMSVCLGLGLSLSLSLSVCLCLCLL